MKITHSLVTIEILFAVSLICLLAGCATPHRTLAGADPQGAGASSSPGQSSSRHMASSPHRQSDSGQKDYREILADPGPF